MEDNNNQILLRKEQVELIERLAGLNVKAGLQPAMAKVLALLTVSDETELDFAQIQATLGLSKGATSQAINGLLLLKKIGFKNKIDERKRYFFSRIISWQDEVEETATNLRELAEVHQLVLEQRPEQTKVFNDSLHLMIRFLTQTSDELLSKLATFK
jgi:DNA-binding transcriptional regulator GbsR (MarR family)